MDNHSRDYDSDPYGVKRGSDWYVLAIFIRATTLPTQGYRSWVGHVPARETTAISLTDDEWDASRPVPG